MAWSSGFFNSVSGDRVYTADQISHIFNGLITDGVYESIGNKLVVEPNSGMTVQIGTGRGWFGGRWVNNDSNYLLTLEGSDVLLNRYCAVCVRVDNSDSGRKAEPYLKYSSFANSPVKPTMERTETVKEYCLAHIYIKAGVTSITAADIEDTRGDTSLCGWVTGLIDQVDTDTLWKQWNALFNNFMDDKEDEFLDWFNSLSDYMNDNIEVQLAADMLAVKKRCIKAYGAFDGLGWNSNGLSGENLLYTQTITVDGVSADKDIIVAPREDYKDTYIMMDCEPVSVGNNTITFECSNPQDVDVVMEVIILNLSDAATASDDTGITGTLNVLTLKDTYTGTKYDLKVTDSKLTMEEHTGSSGDSGSGGSDSGGNDSGSSGSGGDDSGGNTGSDDNTSVLTITQQPQSITVDEGEDATFSVRATTTLSGATLSYHWQHRDANDSVWTTINGYGNTFIFGSCGEDENGMLVRCIVKDGVNEVTSDIVELTVNVPEIDTSVLAITQQPQDATATDGNAAEFAVVATGKDLTFQWEVSRDNGDTWEVREEERYYYDINSSATSSSIVCKKTQAVWDGYSDHGAGNGHMFRCVITDSNGDSITTNEVTLTVTA